MTTGVSSFWRFSRRIVVGAQPCVSETWHVEEEYEAEWTRVDAEAIGITCADEARRKGPARRGARPRAQV